MIDQRCPRGLCRATRGVGSAIAVKVYCPRVDRREFSNHYRVEIAGKVTLSEERSWWVYFELSLAKFTNVFASGSFFLMIFSF
jgi:hypothetical protein